MKKLGFIALIVLFVIPSICMADMYSQTVYYIVNVYAYEGPNGESGPYFLGFYCESVEELRTTEHDSGDEHLGDITRTRDEWWSTRSNSSVPGIGNIFSKKQQPKPDVSEKSTLTDCWKNLHNSYDAERTTKEIPKWLGLMLIKNDGKWIGH